MVKLAVCEAAADLGPAGEGWVRLNATAVLGSRPIEIDGRSVNQGFVWTRDIGISGYHTKQFFPNEDGF